MEVNKSDKAAVIKMTIILLSNLKIIQDDYMTRKLIHFVQ